MKSVTSIYNLSITYKYTGRLLYQMSSIFLQKQKLEDNRQERIYSNRLRFRNLRYFLRCQNCFWKASTLSITPYQHDAYLKKCPLIAMIESICFWLTIDSIPYKTINYNDNRIFATRIQGKIYATDRICKSEYVDWSTDFF